MEKLMDSITDGEIARVIFVWHSGMYHINLLPEHRRVEVVVGMIERNQSYCSSEWHVSLLARACRPITSTIMFMQLLNRFQWNNWARAAWRLHLKTRGHLKHWKIGLCVRYPAPIDVFLSRVKWESHQYCFGLTQRPRYGRKLFD